MPKTPHCHNETPRVSCFPVIEFQQVSINYGAQDVLEDIDLRIHAGERIGIVGPNGAGKSTLFQLILGQRHPDSGRVQIEGTPAIGHLRQHPAPAHSDETLLSYVIQGVARIQELDRRIHRLQADLAAAQPETPAYARLMRELGRLQTEFEHLEGYDLAARARAALGGLGFAGEAFDQPFATLSGGWRMRAELTRVLLAKPDLLLLDEPSNYLDLPAVEWLQRFLRGFAGTMLLISHDRYLLRSLTNLTLEVDAGAVTRYAGDLDYYLREREVRFSTLAAAKANQDRRRDRLERFVERFKSQANKASQAQSRVKMIERMEEIRLPQRSRAAGHLRLAPAPHCGAEVMRLENVDFSYDGERNILSGIDLRINRGDRIAIVGFNGMGKTTLLRLLAGRRLPTSGRRVPGHKVVVGYQSQDSGETIPPELTVLGSARRAAPNMPEKDLRTQLGGFGFTADDVDKQVGVLSGGERIRLAFAILFLAPPNLLLLDEPTTHLDLEGRRTLETALRAYNGTICLVSHDVDFVRATATSVISIAPAGLVQYPGTYDEFRAWLTRHSQETPEARPRREIDAEAREASGASLGARELRKRRADIRTGMQPRIAPLKKRVEQAEKRIESLEKEERELSAQLAAAAPGLDFAALGTRLRQVQCDLHRTALEWEQKATRLEQLQNQLQAQLDRIE